MLRGMGVYVFAGTFVENMQIFFRINFLTSNQSSALAEILQRG